MKHLNLSATPKEKQALAKSLAASGLDQKVRDIKQYNSSFSFENGDRLVIESGYATPHTFTDRNGQETQFLGFDATVKRGNRSFDIVVSVRTLTSPTFSLEKSENIKRSDLRYRYGRQILDFEEVEAEGKQIMLAKLPQNLSCTITVADTAYLPDFDSYDSDSKEWASSTPANHYGYAK